VLACNGDAPPVMLERKLDNDNRQRRRPSGAARSNARTAAARGA
jgi:hypothetical protein